MIRWNDEKNECKVFDEFPKGLKMAGSVLFSQIILIQNVLWMIPYNANMILKMDINDLKIRQVKCENQSINVLLQEGRAFEGVKLVEDTLYLVPANYNALVVVDLITEKFQWIEIKPPFQNPFIDKFDKSVLDEDYRYSSLKLCLEEYCKTVDAEIEPFYEERKRHYVGMVDNFGINCGQIIWDYVKDEYIKEGIC